MALVNDAEASALRKLFAGMDAGDEAGAVCAMNKAAIFLRQHDLSFRQIIQQTEARGLLLPVKIGAAIQLMDSTTLAEAEGALAGARRLMRSCGLTFARIIDTLDREPAENAEFERLKCAYQIEVERSREMAEELQFLRATAMGVSPPVAGTPFKNFVLVTTLLFGVLLAASIVSSIMDLFEPANQSAKPRGGTMVQRAAVDPGSAQPAAPICWRDRSIHGRCF